MKQTVCKVLKIFQYGKYLVALHIYFRTLEFRVFCDFFCSFEESQSFVWYSSKYMKISREHHKS